MATVSTMIRDRRLGPRWMNVLMMGGRCLEELVKGVVEVNTIEVMGFQFLGYVISYYIG